MYRRRYSRAGRRYSRTNRPPVIRSSNPGDDLTSRLDWKRALSRSVAPKYAAFKLRTFYNIQSTAANAINAAFRITRPDNIDGLGTALQDWTNLAAMYDHFKITGIKLQWVPDCPNEVIAATNAYRPLYTFIDFDNTGLVPTNSTALSYDNCRVFSMNLPWSRYFAIPQLTPAVATAGPLGFFDCQAPQETGAIYLCQQAGLLASTVYGTLTLVYYVKCSMRN